MKLSHCTPRLRLYLTIYRTIIWFAEIYFCDTKKIYLENATKTYIKETFEDKIAAIIIGIRLLQMSPKFSRTCIKVGLQLVKKIDKKSIHSVYPLKGLIMKVKLIHKNDYQCRNTWNPNIPIDVAVETSFGPNQTAAILAGSPRVNICATAQTVCANIRTGNRSGETQATFNHAPRAFRKAPATRQTLTPFFFNKKVPGNTRGIYTII